MNQDAGGICNKCSQRPKLDLGETANLLKYRIQFIFCFFKINIANVNVLY